MRVSAFAVPLLLTPRPLSVRDASPGAMPPPPRTIDVWLGHGEGSPASVGRAELAALRPPIAAPFTEGTRDAPRTPAAPLVAQSDLPARLGEGFQIVGSVAVLQGDAATTTAMGPSFGVTSTNLAEVTRRFIRAFGDDYDEISIFLTFVDRLSVTSLAYQLPVKNDVTGLGRLPLFDASRDYGSNGRLETVLNMKRILQYGTDAANDPDNALYPVWAQEAAHRWLVYFRYQRADDPTPSDGLLGRQDAHWAPGVQAGGSFMDGFLWRDNGDDTYTPIEYGRRYGALDHYGMGLRLPVEVPPFFLLRDFIDEEGQTTTRIRRGNRYRATRIDLTIDDVIRGSGGPRTPAIDPMAQDLRMGVVLLTNPGLATSAAIGESSRLDATRRLWTQFYDDAVEGRGKICTELLRPCRGPSFVYGAAALEEAQAGDGVVAPTDTFVLRVPVTNLGDERAAARVQIHVPDGLLFNAPTAETGPLAPGESGLAELRGRVPRGIACGAPLRLDVTAAGRLGPSRGSIDLTVGLKRQLHFGFEEEDDGWIVDPDGTDDTRSGAWRRGAPERTEAFDFVVQPGAAPEGLLGFVTDPTAGATESSGDLDGTTTLESPPLSLAGLRRPWLSYRAWFVAADFDQQRLVPGVGDALSIQASVDDGAFVEIDRLTGMSLGWQTRRFRLAEVLPAAAGARSLRLRFVATDAGLGDNAVEAGVDDLTLLDEVPACDLAASDGGADVVPLPEGGCACAIATSREAGATVPWLAAALGWAIRGRRARRSSRAREPR